MPWQQMDARPLVTAMLTSPFLQHNINISMNKLHDQGSKFHSFDHLRQVKMTVGQVEYLQYLSTAYFWFSHKLHLLYIFQTCEWDIRISDFYNPLARLAFNLKFPSLMTQISGFPEQNSVCCPLRFCTMYMNHVLTQQFCKDPNFLFVPFNMFS